MSALALRKFERTVVHAQDSRVGQAVAAMNAAKELPLSAWRQHFINFWQRELENELEDAA